jgi:hypothetical protein
MLNLSNYVFGKICKNGHEYENTGMSLRAKVSRNCIECVKLRVQTLEAKEKRKEYRRRPEVAEKHRKRSRDYAARNKGKVNEKNRQYQKANKERINEQKKRSRNENREEVNKKRREYHKTFGYRAFDLRRRSKKFIDRGVVIGNVKGIDLKNRFNLFEGCCAYCGDTFGEWDHFIPLCLGGPHLMSNIFPSCISCNSKKAYSDGRKWYPLQKFFTQERWNKILGLIHDGRT